MLSVELLILLIKIDLGIALLDAILLSFLKGKNSKKNYVETFISGFVTGIIPGLNLIALYAYLIIIKNMAKRAFLRPLDQDAQ